MIEIQTLDKDNLAEFLTLEERVLILGKSDCVKCNEWQDELNAAIADGSFAANVPIGKLNIDQRGLGDFKRSTEWLREVDDLPYNAIYKGGEVQKRYVGGGLDRLVNRLKRLELVAG